MLPQVSVLSSWPRHRWRCTGRKFHCRRLQRVAGQFRWLRYRRACRRRRAAGPEAGRAVGRAQQNLCVASSTAPGAHVRLPQQLQPAMRPGVLGLTPRSLDCELESLHSWCGKISERAEKISSRRETIRLLPQRYWASILVRTATDGESTPWFARRRCSSLVR